ncbi:MAG TPA: stage III sporulation protein AC [Clostridiales bacterium]|nr:stage III sporulation protein AC [Clostridiales bacterium]
MEIDLIFKIASIGIIVAVLNTLLKNSNRDEQAMMVTIAGLIIVLMVITKEISSLFSQVRNLFDL